MVLPLPTLDQIHRAHAEQLAYFTIDYENLPPADDQPPLDKEDITGWIKENIKAIQQAQASRELLAKMPFSR